MASRRIIAWFLVAAAGAAVLQQLVPSLASSRSETPPELPAARDASPPVEGLASLPVREAIAPSQGELFGPRSWEAPRASGPGRSVAKRSAPPMPYRIAGQMTDGGGVRVVLAKGHRVYAVREGDTLEDGYRVESIRPDAVILVYLPLARRERLEVFGKRLQLDRPAHAASGASAAR